MPPLTLSARISTVSAFIPEHQNATETPRKTRAKNEFNKEFRLIDTSTLILALTLFMNHLYFLYSFRPFPLLRLIDQNTRSRAASVPQFALLGRPRVHSFFQCLELRAVH